MKTYIGIRLVKAEPMTKVIVENNKVELVEGLQSVVNNTFVVD